MAKAQVNKAEEGSVSRMSEDEVAELMAKREGGDAARSGRSDTTVETKTVVEDRTEEPARRSDLEYHMEEQELDNGTVLTSYGDVKSAA